MNQLTNKTFWHNYWYSKQNIYQYIPANYIFSDVYEKIISTYSPQTAIEIGGFPGFYSVFLTKYYKIKCSLLDLVVIPHIIEKLIATNQLPKNSIQTIETDFFESKLNVQFDLVHSHGFIEHFDNTEYVIKQHVQLLKNNGTLLITIPNFRSINGLFQKYFDRQNYLKHNIACMDISFLKKIAQKLHLHNVKVFYYGYSSIWLEETAKKNKLAVLLRICLHYPLKAFCKLFKINHKWTSPYIVLIATT